MRLIILILIAVSFIQFSGCSNPVSPVLPTPIRSFQAIDFGDDPIQREADTSISVAADLSGVKGGLAIVFSGDESAFSALYSIHAFTSDDSVLLSLRFLPTTVSSYVTDCYLISGSDTLSQIALQGKGTPFKRRVGDSYIFANDSTGTLDSIWVSSLPLKFGTRDSTYLDQMIRSISDRDTVWPCNFYGVEATLGGYPVQEYLAIRSNVLFDSEWTYVDTTLPGSYRSTSVTSGRTPNVGLDTVDGHQFSIDMTGAAVRSYFSGHIFRYQGDEEFSSHYSPELGFFTRIDDEIHDYLQGPENRLNQHVQLHLVRYHLHR